MPALKTLIFDLGNVIIPFDFRRGYAALEERTGLPAAEIPARIGATGLVVELESGRIAPRPFVAAMNEVLGTALPYEEFAAIWSSIFFPETLIPYSFVAHLKQRYRLVLLSNTNAIHFEMVRQHYPILELFDQYVLSHEVQAMKPEPAIYAAALAAAQAEPGECFFTDDIPAYVEGARAAGISAEVFGGLAKLRADLGARGVVLPPED